MSGFIIWWYSAGFQWYWQVSLWLMYRLSDNFSLDILIRTLFAPWKNDRLSAQNISLADKFKLWQWNMVSRLIGFIVRVIVLLIGCGLIALLAIGLSIIAACWVFLPAFLVLIIILGLKVAGLL